MGLEEGAMNYFRRTEKLLYDYKTLVAEVKNIDIEISELEYIGSSAINYNEKTQSTNKFNSVVENEVINRDARLTKLKDLKFHKENQIKRVDNALESLDERSRRIIELLYFDKIPRKKVSEKLFIAESWVWKIKTKAVDKISKIIFDLD